MSEKTFVRFPVELDLKLQNDLRDACYFSGQSRQSIGQVAMRTEVDRLLAKFATDAQRADTERQRLTPKPLPNKKNLIKKGVKNNG